MLGSLNPNSKDVTVVGAGISGLLAADALDRAGYRVTLIEADSRAGGLIQTTELSHGIAEAAAHSVQVTSAVRELSERLGLKWLPVRKNSRARYIWRRGRLQRFPLGFFELVRLIARACVVLAPSAEKMSKMTIEQWALHFLGRPSLNFLLVPFLRGIFGARPSEIQVALAFPGLAVPVGHSLMSFQLRRLRERIFSGEGRSKRDRPVMMAPEAGMEGLVRALELSLKARLGRRFVHGECVHELPQVQNVVLCVPAPEAARLIASVDAKTAQALRDVVYSPLVSATVFVEKRYFLRLPQGVGVLLPEGTSRKALGILFNSSAFEGRVKADESWVSLTVMMGGSADPDLVQASDAQLREWVKQDLEKVLDLEPTARLEMKIHRWKRAVPQYNQELETALRLARQGWCSTPGRILFGNYTGQVSIRGMVEDAARISHTV